jgi:hypothetical protein
VRDQLVLPVYSLWPIDNNPPNHLPQQFPQASHMRLKIRAPGGDGSGATLDTAAMSDAVIAGFCAL